MRRKKWDEECTKSAKKILPEEDFTALINAMKLSSYVLFTYEDKEEKLWTYRRVTPKGFMCAGEIYLYAYHDLHKRYHTFIANKVSNVREVGNLIVALIEPEKYRTFWDGSALGTETTEVK